MDTDTFGERTMNKSLGQGLSLLALVTLGIVSPLAVRKPIEQEIAQHSTKALAEVGLGKLWSVAASGFDVTLTGPAAESERAKAAVERALHAQIPWEASVAVATPTPPPQTQPPHVTPPTPAPAPQSTPNAATASTATELVQLVVHDGMVYLRGVYPDSASRQRVLARAEAVFGGSAIRDESSLSPDGGAAGWPEKATTLFASLKSVRQLTLSAGGDGFTVSGVVSSSTDKQRIETAIQTALPKGVFLESRLSTSGAPSDPPVPTVATKLPEARRAAVQKTISQVAATGEVLFATASSRIRPEAFPYLDQLAQALRAAAPAVVVIGGHTDNQGEPTTNQQLSQKRAESVRAYLIAKGVSSRQLFARGYGASQPLTSNDTEQGRRRNRRIGFVVH